MSKQCPFGGKVSFGSERAAKRVRGLVGRQKKGLRVYRCPNCYQFHITSRLS